MHIICPSCNEQMEDGHIRCVCGYEFDSTPVYDELSDLSKIETASGSDLSKKEITSGSLIITDTSISYEIIIPPKQSGFVYVHLGLEIICLTILEVLSMVSYVNKRKILNLPETETQLIFLMGALAICVVFMVYAWIWNHTGKEHIILTRGALIIKKDIYGYGHKRVYYLNRIKNIRTSFAKGENPKGFRGSSILFDYGSATHRFGLSNNEEEAQFIVNELYKRNPFQAS